jgi:hypothetical protein
MSALIYLLINIITLPVINCFSSNISFVFVLRLLRVIVSSYFLLLLIAFVYIYYKHTIQDNRIIYLANIIFFYLVGVVFFCLMYLSLYCLYPALFRVDDSFPKISRTLQQSGIDNIILRIHFTLFSAFHSINGSYFRIDPNSVIISIITYIQSLFSLSLVSLFIASYVNQKTKK